MAPNARSIGAARLKALIEARTRQSKRKRNDG
jgi:hypothetical protein